ncbi:hypothetical protein F2P81_021558 [Scophthalmus maximus]|uniref:Uncharacterized protein n=1 Tax=Scophthalmus maximus TaxID=52904 RepID=A0A6A4S6Q5_SCOMX|nr:hypothetical protein F2P81_021558 [Scophthalmus maximus]
MDELLVEADAQSETFVIHGAERREKEAESPTQLRHIGRGGDDRSAVTLQDAANVITLCSLDARSSRLT